MTPQTVLNLTTSAGAVLEGFLNFPETTQDFPLTMGAPLFSYNISRGIRSGLNSGVNWPLFQLKVKEIKCSEDFFFGRHKGKLETFAKICVAVSLETLHEDLTVRPSTTNRLLGNYSAKSLEPPLFSLSSLQQAPYSLLSPLSCKNGSKQASKQAQVPKNLIT